MAKYAGIENKTISVISNTQHIGCDIPIPIELQDKTISELQSLAKVKNNTIVSKGKPKKMAFIGNLKMRCGISTYNENLLIELLPLLDETRLFIERNANPTSSVYELGKQQLANDQVLACWKRGEPLDDLIVAVKEYDPDVVIVSHEYGIFPNARYWLSLMTQLSEYRVIVILHSVFPHHQDKVVIEASIKECVVHLEGARKALLNKGVSSKVHVIPHGCYTADQSRLWNIYRSEQTVIQTGFGFSYKGWKTSIKTIALLKDAYPKLFFTGIFSETDFNIIEHNTYYNELMMLIDELRVRDNVALIRGFQSEKVIGTFMRTNTVCLLPYESDPKNEVFGASGAARLAMAHGIPVITSTFHHFEDLPTIKANGVEAMAKELDKLFKSKLLRQEQVKKQNTHVSANSFAVIAKQYHDLLTG